MAGDEEFPCTLTLTIPFPSPHLATTALRALSVDAELSHLVRRTLSLSSRPSAASTPTSNPTPTPENEKNLLVVNYAATTNRMLRVAVNGFFESVGVVIGVMKDLDIDVIDTPGIEALDGVQGLETV
ncbi:Pcc1-domain-containing protein, partial [Lindgomyces ingoldianus]